MTEFKDALLFLDNFIVQNVEGSYIAELVHAGIHMCLMDVAKNHHTVKISFLDQRLHPNLSPIANFSPLVKM